MTDELYMQHCIELAQRGRDLNAPNPKVGALLVYQNRIIGKGWHKRYGEAHAEVNAIRSVAEKDQHLIAQSTIYVTLEPCQMCAGALYWSQISNIVYGARDEERGCIKLNTKLHPKTVIKGGVMAEEASQLLKKFFIQKRNLN